MHVGVEPQFQQKPGAQLWFELAIHQIEQEPLSLIPTGRGAFPQEDGKIVIEPRALGGGERKIPHFSQRLATDVQLSGIQGFEEAFSQAFELLFIYFD